MKLEYVSANPQETFDLGYRIGKQLKGGESILLRGDLGAGKTLITRGIARGLEVDESTPVVSPSFTLVNVYRARLIMVHVDLYRIGPDEIPELGLEDFMDDEHVLIIEWADIAQGFFNRSTMDIDMEYTGETSRKITITGSFSLEQTENNTSS